MPRNLVWPTIASTLMTGNVLFQGGGCIFSESDFTYNDIGLCINDCLCGSNVDCPLPDDCHEVSCVEGKCKQQLKRDMSPGDCYLPECDGYGQMIQTPGDDPPLPDECNEFVCNLGVVVMFTKTESACGDNNSDVCSDAGKCEDCSITSQQGCEPSETCYDKGGRPACSTCHDGLRNGEEVDIDCGGEVSLVPGCGKCLQGKACMFSEDCDSNFCEQGVCCNKPCDSDCRSCDQLSNPGQCAALPPGTVDPRDPSCVCDTAADCTTLAPTGAMCYADSNCASGECRCGPGGCGSPANPLGECRQPVGTSCAVNDVCVSDKCDMGLHLCIQ